jgi:hypothetical protein
MQISSKIIQITNGLPIIGKSLAFILCNYLIIKLCSLRYRDSDNFNHHTSILSSISENYNIPCYEEVSRDLDVNLAQVDMEHLKTEDIHNILSTLPSMCGQDLQV